MNHASPLNRLRWQCRRGLKELDLMLAGYLERRYPAADVEEQQLFWQLLELPDDTLLQYFFEPSANPEDDGLALLVKKIRVLQ